MRAVAQLAAWCRDILAGGRSVPPFDAALLGVVESHRVGPWLYDALQRSAALAASPWGSALRAMAVRSLAQTGFDDRVRREVLRALRGAGAPGVPLKGTVFGRLLYRAPHLRPSHDLDVWIEPHAWTRAEVALLSLGFRRASRGKGAWLEAMSHERAYWRGDDLPVELHRNITQAHRFRVMPSELAAARVPWMFDGVETERFNDEVLAAHAIIHAAHHKFVVPLIHWIDLALLMPRVRPAAVAELCERWQARHALWVAATTLQAHFGTAALAPFAPAPGRVVRVALRHRAPRSRTGPGWREHWLGFWLIERPGERWRFGSEYVVRRALDWVGGYSSRQLRSSWGWRSRRRVRLAGSSALSAGRNASPHASQ